TRLGTVAAALTEEGQSRALATAVIENMRGKLVESTSEIIKQQESWQRLKTNVAEFGEGVGKRIIERIFEISGAIQSLTDKLQSSAVGEGLKRLDQYLTPKAQALTNALGLVDTGDEGRKMAGLADALDADARALANVRDVSTSTAGQVDKVKDALFK